MKYLTSDDEWAELAGSPTPQTSRLSLWLSMKGRIPRKTYWLKFLVPIFLIQFLAAFADGMAGYTDPDVAGPPGDAEHLFIRVMHFGNATGLFLGLGPTDHDVVVRLNLIKRHAVKPLLRNATTGAS